MTSIINTFTFPVQKFYGKSCQQRQVDKNTSGKLSKIKIPKQFPLRIQGPTTIWQTFVRQKNAFQFASKFKDVCVFAFENADGCGKRRYLVTSLPVFWHCYSQLDPDQRHHYEIIPEGYPCKLYFDLEYMKDMNKGNDGDQMVEILIQYVCMWLKTRYSITCSRSDVLDLDASTSSKFSRHLIFQLKDVFENCQTAGLFVRYIFQLLAIFVKVSNPVKSEPSPSSFKNNQSSDGDFFSDEDDKELSLLSYPKNIFSDVDNVSNDERSYVLDPKNDLSDVDNVNVNNNEKSYLYNPKNDLSDFEYFSAEDNEELTCMTRLCEDIYLKHKNCASSPKNNLLLHITPFSDIGTTAQAIPHAQGDATCILTSVNESGNITNSTGDSRLRYRKISDFSDQEIGVFNNFSFEDLSSLIVKNKDGNETLFCDLGVYTKNRNFRLYLSSKLHQSNPLFVSSQNQFTLNEDGQLSHKLIFFSSLVTVQHVDPSARILQSDNNMTTELRPFKNFNKCALKNEAEGATGGNQTSSPYPLIDAFIQSLISSPGCHGNIYQWRHFPSNNTLVYSITGYRWCGHVQRHHRSNNIMYVVDLQSGVYYQKCFDPDCQAVGYRSQALDIPYHILPSSFFEQQHQSVNVEEDNLDEYLNDDGDDVMLVSAVDELEMGS